MDCVPDHRCSTADYCGCDHGDCTDIHHPQSEEKARCNCVYSIACVHIAELELGNKLAGAVETVEMKDNMSYGPVRLQSQTATQEPVYEEADILQQPVNVHTRGNVAYGYIRP